MKTKKTAIIISVIVLVVIIVGAVLWYVNIKKPHDIALQDYQTVTASITEKNTELDNAISNLQGLIDSGEKPLDSTTIDTAKEVIKNAQATKTLVEEPPQKTEEIIAKTQSLVVPDYTETLNKINTAHSALDASIKQYKHFLTPTEDFIIKALQTVDEIKDARAVTEDNDPNGNLNKPGGYTATVYFESTNVDQSSVYGTDLIDKGTNAGGAIEVYANENDAIKRRDYLASFDGGMLSSGSHTVIGTTLIRTSDELPASKQKALEDKVIKAIANGQ